jgi:hypothetical protein
MNNKLLVYFLLSVNALVFGQSAGTGALTGTVTDPTGNAVPNAVVTITNTGTNQSRTATTGLEGTYRFNLLQPGTYSVKFSAGGFKTAEVSAVSIGVTETPVLDRQLELGQQSEQITVEAAAETLQTASSTLGTTVGGRTVTALPLSNRNYTQVLGLSAGVNAGVNNAATFGKATQDFSVNGMDPGQNNYQMDGVAINNIANSGSSNDSGIYTGIPIPNPDALQEFKIQTSTYDASYGRNPGANVNVITKSGSNQFHGSLFEFFRNEALNANSFFYNRDNPNSTHVKQVLKQNQFGGTIGGPVVKDKLFFFGSYQGTRQVNGVAAQGSAAVVLPPIPAGDRSTPAFRAALGAAMCPANHPGNSAFTTFLYPIIPSIQVACDGSNLNPVSLAMLNLKNQDGSYYIQSSGTGLFTPRSFSIPARYTEDQYIVNGDYVVSSKNTIATRYFHAKNPQDIALNNNLPGTPIHIDYGNTNAVLKLTTLIKPNLINEARVSFQRNYQLGRDFTPGSPQDVGQTPIVPTMKELPVTVIFGGPSMFGSLYPSYSPTNQLQLADQVSLTRGRHTMRMGYEYEHTHWPIVFAGLERGFLFYGSFADWLIGRAGCAPSQAGCSVANPGNTNGAGGNILQCLFCVRSGPDGIIHGYLLANSSAFFQDDFKVNSQLSLNLGVRWEYDGTFSDKFGNLTNFWTSQLRSVPVPPTGPNNSAAGLAGYVVPSNYLEHYPQPPAGVLVSDRKLPVKNGPPFTNFGPRFGFAWQPKRNGRLVVRGGFGIFYDRVAGDRFVHGLEQGYPYAVTLDYSGAGSAPFSNQNPYPSTPLGTFAARWANLQTGATSNLNTPAIVEDLHTPLIRQYNLTFQYQFFQSWVLEAGYVGSSGLNLVNTYHVANTPLLASPANPVNGITVNTSANASLRVPFLGYQPAGYQVTSFDGISNYNSLQLTIRKQFSRGLSFQGAYTWSKNLSDLTNTAANSNDPSDLAQQYGPVSFTRPHRFIANYSYDLPLGDFSGLAGKALKGWNISGVTTVQSGSPMTITDQNGGTVYGLGTFDVARAQMCPGMSYANIATSGDVKQRLGGVSGGPGFFNASAFCSPPAAPNSQAAFPGGPLPTLFGNTGLGIIRGPGQFNWDISIIKDTRIGERQDLQFRTEFFNTFNHAQFANPAAAVSTPSTFGWITATTVNPRVIQFALKYAF